MPAARLSLRQRMLNPGRWSLVLCLASVPVNKPAVSIFLFLALVFSLLGPEVRARFNRAMREPVVLGTTLWFIVLFLNALFTPAGDDRWSQLSSYKALLYPLIVASLLTTQEWRIRALAAFAIAVAMVLLLSWSQLFGLMPAREITDLYEAYRYTVFKDYSQQGLQFLMLAALAASFAGVVEGRWTRRLLWLLAAAAVANVAFLLQSRTAYLVIAPLLLYWGWRLLAPRLGGVRGLLIGLLLLATLIGVAALTPRVQDRIDMAMHDIVQYQGEREATSLGIRLELWRRTMPIIAAAPWFGHGIGEWDRQYFAQTKNEPDFEGFRMKHPHQEALFFLAEVGIVGFSIFVLLLQLLGRHIAGMPPPYRDFYASLLLIYITAGLANCILVDSVHRHGFLMLLACSPLLLKKVPHAKSA